MAQTYYIPVQEKASIHSYAKWEQAFRVFANIYSKVNPHRSTELIDYNHIIHTILTVYHWDNVYMYDKDFHIHMGRNPERNWSTILQQSWSLRLKDRIQGTPGGQNFQNGASPKEKSTEACKRYNKGKCNFGSGCKFDHKCLYCHKFGHTILTCRKLIADIERERGRSSYYKRQMKGETLSHRGTYNH